MYYQYAEYVCLNSIGCGLKRGLLVPKQILSASGRRMVGQLLTV